MFSPLPGYALKQGKSFIPITWYAMAVEPLVKLEIVQSLFPFRTPLGVMYVQDQSVDNRSMPAVEKRRPVNVV